ncbi:hypothetical protein K504DRAFT_93148 [Pleomassaria siparia CBS 279.74]|uniref:Uncharacterized protein n=1 Tax=Pleomassaria siparia CBS 279.74 TaxID=1314801 RepID=A0A6G1JYI3_9PLEO|nr:hypothetical protein K504DRAFT_93148 [Pleomassaria siparia CBS 279.74]
MLVSSSVAHVSRSLYEALVFQLRGWLYSPFFKKGFVCHWGFVSPCCLSISLNRFYLLCSIFGKYIILHRPFLNSKPPNYSGFLCITLNPKYAQYYPFASSHPVLRLAARHIPPGVMFSPLVLIADDTIMQGRLIRSNWDQQI